MKFFSFILVILLLFLSTFEKSEGNKAKELKVTSGFKISQSTLDDIKNILFIRVVLPVISDMLCKSCSELTDKKERRSCKKKLCTPRLRVAVTDSTTIIEQTIHKYVSEAKVTTGPIDDPRLVIPIVTDMVCEICKDSTDHDTMIGCQKKYCAANGSSKSHKNKARVKKPTGKRSENSL